MATAIPLAGRFDTPQERPNYPLINLNIIPAGLVVNIQLGPTTNISQLIDANTMDQVAKTWRESRKNADDLLRAVQGSKL